MARKTKHSQAGRPPKKWYRKFMFAVRAMVTTPIAGLLVLAQALHGIDGPDRGLVASDILRLYVYRGLDHDGLLDKRELVDENGDVYLDDNGQPMEWNPREDPTWDSLREKGLV